MKLHKIRLSESLKLFHSFYLIGLEIFKNTDSRVFNIFYKDKRWRVLQL